MSNFPIVRIELEGVRLNLVHHLGMALERHKDEIERQVNAALADFDLGAMVREVVRRETPRLIEHAIKSKLEYAISRAVNEKGTEVAQRAIEKMMRGDVE